MAGENDLNGFRDIQLRLVSAVIAVAAVSIAVMASIGPWLVESLFGDEIGARDMALLSASGGGLMVMLSLSIGLVALDHTHLAVVGFVVGVAVFPVAILVANEPFLQVESALVAAVTAGSLVTAVLLKYEYSVHIRSGRMRVASGAE
jgi:ABC-type uncharacterized transport system permease subunit